MELLTAGKQAPVVVLNDKLDPVQTAAVEIAARLAVQEVNASIMATLVGKAQDGLAPNRDVVTRVFDASATLSDAAARQDPVAIRQAASELSDRIDDLRLGTAAVSGVLDSVDVGGDPQRARFDSVRSKFDEVNRLASEARNGADNSAVAVQRAAAISQSLDAIRPQIDQLASVDASVLVRPFTAATRTVLPQPIGVTAFFAPSSIALLLQHLALSLAALALARDRALGLLEILRVGPTSVVAIVVGRFIAFAVAGGVVGAALLAAVTNLLDVPSFGSPVWIWVAVALLLVASVALGMVIALVSRTDSEVVQYAMLVLLASLFFGGFVLDLHLFNSPGKVISWLLPVTYGIRILQQVMLRGHQPDANDFAALGAQIVVYGSIAVVLFRRRLRVS
jgi:ABC-2 type transport system permease protein